MFRLKNKVVFVEQLVYKYNLHNCREKVNLHNFCTTYNDYRSAAVKGLDTCNY